MATVSSPLVVPASYPAVTGVIDQGSEFEGNLAFRGTFRIGGVFRGEIYTPDTLIVSEGARIHGKIDAGTVIISGEVHGSIRARHRVEIQRPAIFKGDIITPSLRVDDGVVFEGRSKMVAAAQAGGIAPQA